MNGTSPEIIITSSTCQLQEQSESIHSFRISFFVELEAEDYLFFFKSYNFDNPILTDKKYIESINTAVKVRKKESE